MKTKLNGAQKISAYLIFLVFIITGVLVGLYGDEFNYCYQNNVDFVWGTPWDMLSNPHRGYNSRLVLMLGLGLSIFVAQVFLRLVYGREAVDELFIGPKSVLKPNDIKVKIKKDGSEPQSYPGTQTFRYKMTSSPFMKITRLLNFALYVFAFCTIGWTFFKIPGGIHLGASVWGSFLLLPIIIFFPMVLGQVTGRGTIEVSSEGIVQTNFFGKRTSILWSDVKELTVRTGGYAGGLGVVNQGGKTVIYILDRFDQAEPIKAKIFSEYKGKVSS
jgi:hypothetical protein